MRPSESFMAWFGPLVIIGIFVWVLFGNSTSHEIMCGKSETCFRDWVFGLSGWAAAAVAAVTLGALWKQISIAQMQAQDTFSIELRRSMALAQNTIRASQELHTWSTLFGGTPAQYDTSQAWTNLRNNIADVNATLALEVFTLFEREIGFPKRYHSVFMRERLTEFERAYGRYVDMEIIYVEALRDEVVNDWNAILKQTAAYSLECIAIAEDFLADCGALKSKYA